MNVENVCVLFVKTATHLIYGLIDGLKKQHLFEIKTF